MNVARLTNCNACNCVDIEGKPTIFPYGVLKVSTKNFDPNNKLGEGGFGSVFKVLSPLHVILLNNLHNHIHQVVYKPRDPMLHLQPNKQHKI